MIYYAVLNWWISFYIMFIVALQHETLTWGVNSLNCYIINIWECDYCILRNKRAGAFAGVYVIPWLGS